MQPPERCLILIDGSNFYYKLKDLQLHRLLSFDFIAFTKQLAQANTIVAATYYIGKVRSDGTPKTERLLADQQRLFAHLRRQQVRYSLGYLLRSEGVMHEKGVDVNMAVDMLVATYEDRCDRLIVVSSDTDLIPAIKQAQAKGKIVEYVGFSHKRSMGLLAVCHDARLLKREDLAPLLAA
ncbi:MAG: NYN domain-containing protein [Ktedonobacteraceae bacterium]|nr:NYN domain-containing protein [Ktedonobacteraceae bacterium]